MGVRAGAVAVGWSRTSGIHNALYSNLRLSRCCLFSLGVKRSKKTRTCSEGGVVKGQKEEAASSVTAFTSCTSFNIISCHLVSLFDIFVFL